MSKYHEVPPIPRALDQLREEASPSSLSRSSTAVAEDSHHDVSIDRRQNGLLLTEGDALAPPLMEPGETNTESKYDASPYLMPIDLRRLSPSPLLVDPDPACFGASDPTDDNSVVKKQRLSAKMAKFWRRNRSCLLVILSSFFGSVMTLFAKLLESGDNGMHPFQILFIRMAATTIALQLILYRARPSEFPLGPTKVRWLLVLRGLFGLIGIAGMWTAILFLDLADATIITFLTPSMVAVYSAVFLKQPFTGKEMLASLLAMLGVVFIARPAILFGDSTYTAVKVPQVSTVVGDGHLIAEGPPTGEDRTAADHLMGVMLALMSAVGGAGACIAIRAIGKRAHALTTTSYFAATCTIVAGMSLGIAPLVGYKQPGLRFGLPHDQTQWMLVIALTVCGILTQLLMTSGLSSDAKSNKATAMVYTGMVWPVGFDRWLFGQDMYWSSILGCGLIVGGAIWIALQPKAPHPQRARVTAGDIEPGVASGEPLEEPVSNSVELAGSEIYEAGLVESDD